MTPQRSILIFSYGAEGAVNRRLRSVMNQPFDPYAAPQAPIVGYAPMQPVAAGTPIDFTGMQALRGSWEVVKKRWKELLPVYLVFGALLFIGMAICIGPAMAAGMMTQANVAKGQPSVTPDVNPLAMIFMGIGGILLLGMMAVMMPGMMRANLAAVRNEEVRVSMLWSETKSWPSYLGLVFWAYLIFAVSIVTLFIYGIWWGIATMPAWYLIMDKKLGMFDAIKEAKSMTEGRRMNIFIAFVLLGALSFILQLFSLIPVINLIAFFGIVALSFVQYVMPAWIYTAIDGSLPTEYESQP